MSSPDKALRKYLDVHAEPESAWVREGLSPDRRYGHVLCIPAYGEGEGLFETLSSIPEGPSGEVLTIVVINETAASPEWVRDANRVSLLELRGRRDIAQSVMGSLVPHPRGDLLVIDRTQPDLSLPVGQGVGLARKIGADVALALWATGGVESPWIHCSDADVRFPPDYFAQPIAATGDLGPLDGPAACIYPFRHRLEADPEIARAALCYELFLRYYVLGLRSAGSPYAFHTIGSTLAISPLAYARARGFPRREAAEDFHLLAKLAKLGGIRPLRGEPLSLSGRVSERVPFGTGAGIAKELGRSKAGQDYPAYDPRVFVWLGVWLRTLDPTEGSSLAPGSSLRDSLFDEATRAEIDGPRLCELLDELGVLAAAESGRARGTRHQHERFDALRTLRFVHHLRERQFPSIPLETAIRAAPFLGFEVPQAPWDLSSTRKTLAQVEAIDLSS